MYICEQCGRESNKKIRYGGYTLCSKHMHQLQKYGTFLDVIPRTQNDLNAYQIQNDEVIFEYYSISSELLGHFIIDLEDLDKVKYLKWRYSHGHIFTGLPAKKTQKDITHVILSVPDNMVVDHIDGNPLNNKKSNLRICTQGENTANKHFMKLNTSGIIGVSRDSRKGRKSNWVADIRFQNKRFRLGSYNTLEEAAYARYLAEVAIFKEFRNTNSDSLKFKLFEQIPTETKSKIGEKIKKYLKDKQI